MADITTQSTMTRDRLDKALETLQKYKEGKANLEARITGNHNWYKMRYYKDIEQGGASQDSASAWLFNSIANKHADAMDNAPEANILPRERSDEQAADALSSVLPVIFERNEFEKVYSDAWWQKLKGGTACYGVYWDKTKDGGLGDVSIRNIDVLNLFWEPGITDIQKSPNLYHVELHNNDALAGQYPQLKGKLGQGSITVTRYQYDDSVDTSDKTPVVDWYYKARTGNRDILHYCKFCNGEALYSSEDDLNYASRGYYDHGKYPFVLDPLFIDEGTPCGFGYIDIMKDAQRQIDIINDNIIRYTQLATKPRYFINASGSVNEEEFADPDKPFIHVQGSNLGDDSLKPVTVPTLSGIYTAILNNKIEELKETSGNRDFSQGSTSGGVTAASAIAALQEAGSKLSRDMIKGSYRAYTQLNYLAIELIRQFYDAPRTFRIVAPDGEQNYINFDNGALSPQSQGAEFGIDLGSRLPVFDIEVQAQRSSPYSKQSQNELALQFYGQGFFAPQNSDAALATLSMMQFDGRESVIETIRQNGTLFDRLMQLQEVANKLAMIVDAQNETSISPQLPVEGEQGAQPTQGAQPQISEDRSLVSQAKRRVADSTVPR